MLEVKNLNKGYFKKIISNFSYIFEKGKIYSIIGPSGCGKSTLLSILSNNNKKYVGTIKYNNKNIKHLKNYTFYDVGYVYQSYQLFENLTAYENVVLYYQLINQDINKIHYKVRQLFSYFNILHLLNNKVKDLSGGEKQRVALIRAFIKDPNIILLDEPTSALDKTNTELLFNYLNRIKKDKIIIMVTHNNDLALKSDRIIDFNNLEKINIVKRKPSRIKENKIKFYKNKWIYKKVFINKKIFNYICTSILSFGLISISLSHILSSFINDVVNKSFINMNKENQLTFKAIKTNDIVDFSKDIGDFETIYYEGLEPNFKKNIKDNSYIEYVDFNYYDIKNVNFIFDNYLSNHDENICLYIPRSVNEYIKEENYINVYYLDKSMSIKIDKVCQSSDENFYLYCNNVSYLQPYFKSINIKYEISSFLYCLESLKLYNHLMNSNLYQNYMFLLDSSNYIIQILPSYYPRLSKSTLNDFLKNCEYDYCLLSDYINTYIDYDTGFSYLLIENEAIQVVVDNTLSDNKINVTSKLKENLKDKEKIDVYKNTLYVQKAIEDNMYSIIYMNSNTFNSLNESIYYCGLMYTKDLIALDKNNNIMVNRSLFEVSSFEVFSHITNFLSLFALIILILSLISSVIIFTINFINKKKDVITLLNFGLYRSKVVQILLYDPINNIISAIISNFICSIISLVVISMLYQQINGSNIELTISISFYLFMFLLPFLMILPLIILKILNFFQKYNQK